MFSEGWNELTPDQRLAARMDALAERACPVRLGGRSRDLPRARTTLSRCDRAEEAGRVPIAPLVGLFPLRYAGYTHTMPDYDAAKLAEAWDKYHVDFPFDGLAASFVIIPGRLFEILDFKDVRVAGPRHAR